MFMETSISSTRMPGPAGQPENNCCRPNVPSYFESLWQSIISSPFPSGLFLPNVRLNVIHQYLLSACPPRGMALCLVSE